MNVRDPFKLHYSPAIRILRAVATQAAADVTHRVLDVGAQAYESGKQAVEDMSSFSIPKNVPSFTNPQRDLEDRLWEGSRMTSRSTRSNGGVVKDMQDKMGSLFGDNKRDLPMYKDKPYSYAASRRKRPLWRKKGFLGFAGLVLLFLLYMFGIFNGGTSSQNVNDGWFWYSKAAMGVDWLDRRERVKEAFVLSWDAYERYAWGYDEYKPISKIGNQASPGGIGWVIVDALDTMILMNLTTRVIHAREWLSTSLDYEQDYHANTFEATTRILGGLLSAYYLSTEHPDLAPISDDDEGAAGEDLYLEKAKDLADRLMGAFESASGVPFNGVNLKTLKGTLLGDNGGASSTAEVTSLQLELKYLSKITGEAFYWYRAEKVIQTIDDNGAEDGLVPSTITPGIGNFKTQDISFGSRGTSYYENLIKQYLQTSKEEPIYEQLWHEAFNGIRKNLVTYSTPSRFTVLGKRLEGLYGSLSPKMDHFDCSLPGIVALSATGGHVESELRVTPKGWDTRRDQAMLFARELMQTCWAMNKFMATGLASESVRFNIDTPALPGLPQKRLLENLDDIDDAAWRKDFVPSESDSYNLQQSQTAESLFYMWRITGDMMYREWGWELFKSFVKHAAVKEGGGFSSLSNANVIPPIQKDGLERFWLPETLKYLYLLFSPNDLLPLDQVVINTAAHPFPRFKLGKLFETGWIRKPRDADGKMTPKTVPGEDAQVVIKEVEEIKPPQ